MTATSAPQSVLTRYLLPVRQIEAITRIQPVIPSTWMGLVVIDRDLSRAHDFETIAVNDKNRIRSATGSYQRRYASW